MIGELCPNKFVFLNPIVDPYNFLILYYGCTYYNDLNIPMLL